MVGKMDASWLQSDVEDAPGLMLSTTQNFTSVQIMSNGQGIIQSLNARSFGAGPEDMFDEGNSIDLSPVKIPPREEQTEVLEGSSGHGQSGHLDFSDDVDDVDDTFHYKRQGKVAVWSFAAYIEVILYSLILPSRKSHHDHTEGFKICRMKSMIEIASSA